HRDRFEDLEPAISDVIDDTDDFPDRLWCKRDAKPLTDRIFAGPEQVRHRMADYGHGLVARGIRKVEVPARQNRNPHRSEIAWSCPPDRHVALECEHLDRTAFDSNRLLGSASHG